MKQETIESITEGSFGVGKYDFYDGFIIKTNLQEIKVGIENGQSCCEQWGYLTSEDSNDLDGFTGGELLSITATDTSLVSTTLEKLSTEGIDIDSAVFITFETTKGTFQITAYNEHNGYYGHGVKVLSTQLNLDITL
jgi:hypothetical protein